MVADRPPLEPLYLDYDPSIFATLRNNPIELLCGQVYVCNFPYDPQHGEPGWSWQDYRLHSNGLMEIFFPDRRREINLRMYSYQECKLAKGCNELPADSRPEPLLPSIETNFDSLIMFPRGLRDIDDEDIYEDWKKDLWLHFENVRYLRNFTNFLREKTFCNRSLFFENTSRYEALRILQVDR